MGLIYSIFNMMGDVSSVDAFIVEETQNGVTTKTTKSKNPFVKGIACICLSFLATIVIDGGNGMISKTFGHRCLKCNNIL